MSDFTTPWTAAYQAPPPMGFSRPGYRSGVPLPSPLFHLSCSSKHSGYYISNVNVIHKVVNFTFFSCTNDYPWRRQWDPTPVLLPGKSHGRRSLVGCSPCGLEESDTTERLPFHFSLSCIGEGNGNPLQCSCLENPGTGKPGGLPSVGSHRVGHD